VTEIKLDIAADWHCNINKVPWSCYLISMVTAFTGFNHS